MSGDNTSEQSLTVSPERLNELIRMCVENATLPNPFWLDASTALIELRVRREVGA